MPKEITHVIIARNVLNHLKACRSTLSGSSIADIIECHQQAFYLGAIIPDAHFYHLLPWPKLPAKFPTVTQMLHWKNRRHNDEVAINLLRAAAADEVSPPVKVAFCAGMITHTVSDGFFHDVIDYYCRQWGETGACALGTHRQLETLFDELLLDFSGQTAYQFPLEASVSVSPAVFHGLLRFSVTELAPPPPTLYGTAVRAFRWAHAQQLFLLRQFKKANAFRMAQLGRKITAGKSEAISALFYPSTISRKVFPVLKRFDVELLTDGKDFEGSLSALIRRITDHAVACILSELAVSWKKPIPAPGPRSCRS